MSGFHRSALSRLRLQPPAQPDAAGGGGDHHGPGDGGGGGSGRAAEAAPAPPRQLQPPGEAEREVTLQPGPGHSQPQATEQPRTELQHHEVATVRDDEYEVGKVSNA